MNPTQTSAMLLGALVADAASLGLHWLYDPDRIAEIATARGSAAFAPVDAAFFEGAKGYFAHAGRHAGMLTQYGEALLVGMRSMVDSKGIFDAAAQRSDFAAHFGPGGAYSGYIDRPTRGALERIAAEQPPSGIDDDQNPALARLPAIVAAYHASPDLAAQAEAAMQITNVNAVAGAYTAVFADLLCRVLNGASVAEALGAAAEAATGDVQAALKDALTTSEADSTVYAGLVGRACHLPTSGPVMFHVLRHSTSYADAVERNILAGGDSAGRSLMIGAAMGAAHGIATPKGIPLDWVLALSDGAAIWEACRALGQD
jgi:ADP-ribosylglycohydrolase